MRKGVKYIICLNILQKIEQLINTNIIKYEPKYLVKILDVKKIDRKKMYKNRINS